MISQPRRNLDIPHSCVLGPGIHGAVPARGESREGGQGWEPAASAGSASKAGSKAWVLLNESLKRQRASHGPSEAGRASRWTETVWGRGRERGPLGGEPPDAAPRGTPPCSLFFVNIILHFKDQ